MPHDVGGQLDERTSTSLQINSLNSQTKTIFHKMATAHVSVTYIELRSAVSAGWLKKKRDLIAVNERPTNCDFTGRFWTVCAYEGLGGFGRSAQ